jgi:hypothetical protein
MMLVAGVANANPIDPQIIVRGGVPPTVHLTGMPVTIAFNASSVGVGGCNYFYDSASQQVTAGTGPLASSLDPNFDHLGCGFVNDTNAPIINMAFTMFFPQAPLFVDCPLTICSQPAIIDPNGGFATVFLTIPAGGDLFIDFMGFSQSNSTTIATNVPEPGTLALLGTGLSALGLWRRRRKA